MATGYTYKVVEGKTQGLKDFALHCATAFIYDCSALPEKFVNDQEDYYKQRLADTKEELKALRALRTTKAQRAYGQNIIDGAIAHNQTGLKTKQVQRERLMAMKKQVVAWKTPKSIQNLKKYMLEQLEDTLRCDGNDKYYREDLERLQKADPQIYYDGALKSAKEAIVEYQKQITQAKKVTKENNQWLKDLRKSLK